MKMKMLLVSVVLALCALAARPALATWNGRLPIAPGKTWGRGYLGFRYMAYGQGWKVVPRNAPLGKLPTVVVWRDSAGHQHQRHLLSGDLGRLMKNVVKKGVVIEVEKAQPGYRWVPRITGEY